MRLSRIGRLASRSLLSVLLAVCATVVVAQDVGTLLPVTEAYKLTADANTPGVVKLHWTIAPNYYLYRGRMKFKAGDGTTLGTAQLPDGEKHDDPYLGPVETYHHGIDATLPYTLAAGATHIVFSVQYQGCHETDPKICYPPHTESFDLPLTGGVAVATPTRGGTSLLAQHEPLLSQSTSHVQTHVSAEPVAATATATAPISLAAALLLALLGGLVLNLMPCVLPVLSIKAIGLLESGDNPQRRRRHALFYTAGVLCAFVAVGLSIVGLRAAGDALGWGSQLQQPLVVGVLACVMFAVGLSMSGVVQFGASLGNAGAGLASRSGPAGDFFTGVLAVVVASPCTAPFMGSALAYAFATSKLVALLVFLALGFGLALPFLAIGFIPALARLLPKPGRWMETLKEILAFPMYLTAVWLTWVLAHQRGADAVGLLLVAMVLLAATLWWFERSRARGGFSRACVALLALLTLVPLYRLAHLPYVAAATTDANGIVAFSPDKLAALRNAGTPVFVDMTADWCVTCKANEHAVLDSDAFRAHLKRNGAVYMKGDWTDVNPTISAFLQQYHSPGVPLYVMFPRNGGPGRELPTVLTASLVSDALDDAAR